MAADPRNRPDSAADLGAGLAALGHQTAAEGSANRQRLPARAPGPCPATPPPAPPISARRLLLALGGTMVLLLAAFTAWDPDRGAGQPDGVPASPSAVKGAQAVTRYAPTHVVVTRGRAKGELIVSWVMPIRPDVVATVIYEGGRTGDAAKGARARSIVNYGTDPHAVPQATVRGPSGQEVCLSAAHLVSLGGSVTSAVSRPACAFPR